MKIIFITISALHGLIHLMGFAKAYNLAEIKELTLPISKPFGLLWLSAFILFTSGTIFYLLKSNQWFWWSLGGIFISQLLIFFFWQDAKYGTAANIIILLAATFAYGAWHFEQQYQKDIKESLARNTNLNIENISEHDLLHLPMPVQRYLKIVGVVGKPAVQNVKIIFTGEMRDKGKDWFAFTSEQYNFYREPERLFFMKASIKGLPTNGYHFYKNNKAEMHVKLLSLFPVVTIKEKGFFKTETVTFFNDLCLFAPAALIDKNIEWEAIDDFSARAYFTNNGTRISAVLYFNKNGELINFISGDRSALIDGALKNYRFSTPVNNHKNFNGFYLPAYGEAVWHYPEGEFTYGRFNVKSIEYNTLKPN